jgi:recombination associated protein RdgC
MWFKNLRIYCLSEDLPCAIGELDDKLRESAFRPCSGMESSSMGWVSPMGPSAAQLVHTIGDFHLLSARTQQRLLPPAAIREVLDEKILTIETGEARKLGRRERADLKDDVIQTLLPRALTRSYQTGAFLAARRKLLLIDAATPARAEDLLNLLRDSIGRLPVKPLVPKHSPTDLMTRWLAGGTLPKPFRLGQHVDLRDTLHQANVVRCRQQELATREVRGHLEAGKQVSGLGLRWNERLDFVLAEDLAIRGLKFAEIVQRESGNDEELDDAARFDADFALMSLELDRLCADLLDVFGGIES